MPQIESLHLPWTKRITHKSHQHKNIRGLLSPRVAGSVRTTKPYIAPFWSTTKWWEVKGWGESVSTICVGEKYWKLYTVLSYRGVVYLLYMLCFKMSCVYCCELCCVYCCSCLVCIVVSCLVCIVVVVLCVLLSSYVYLLYYVCIAVFYFRCQTAG